MASFGQLLRIHRRQCRDPMRGGLLTQERLGEMIGETLGDAGYTGAAVSEWERDKSKIDEDNRVVLIGLVSILHHCGGLNSSTEADALLQAGNYRALNDAELDQLFPGDRQESRGVSPSEDVVSEQIAAETVTPSSMPAQDSTSRARRKQLILLNKVNSFWVEGVLEKSTPENNEVSPHYHHVSHYVENPWDSVVGPATLIKAEDDRQSPLALFLESGRSLLILGEPGAGKTMLLITLAQILITRAEREPTEPIPVILNLMSWAKQQRPLAEWVVEELTAKYMIPRQIGRQWLEDDDLVLLLDGFDDVPARQRRRCVEAINGFRATRGLIGIVVCSRSEEYAAVEVKLKLGAAVEIQPLSDGQIDAFLEAEGPRLAQLQAAIQRDPTMREMARNPLMLSIMSLAYDDVEPEATGAILEVTAAGAEPLSTRRRRLFDTYVNSMFRRRAPNSRFSSEFTVRQLSWLASQMYHFRQTPLLVEQIQPSWLPGRRWRRLYMMLTGLIIGIFAGILMWLLLQILRQTTPQLGTAVAQRVATLFGVGQGQGDILTLLLGNILLGQILALIQGRYFEAVYAMLEEPARNSRLYRRHLVIVAAAIWFLTLVLVSLNGEPLLALAWATAEAFIFAITARYIYGLSYNREIRTVEALGWSWPSALRGLLIGLAAAALFEVMEYLLFGAPDITLSILVPTLGGAVLGGIRGRRVEAKSRPNQGIQLSLRNSFIAGTLSALILTAVAWYIRWPSYALYTGVLTFIAAGALFGGGNVLKHFLVRMLLWLHRDLPWDAIRFLDHAAELIFLRKVGGGYIFIHKLLQQYFASLHQPHKESGANLVRHAADLERAGSGS
ncbi:MAG: NACHT domain-containing protein [Chloroflexota bacterium]|nr:MAG: NACHT domain-containing protein [Chloroflexota bacterium]